MSSVVLTMLLAGAGQAPAHEPMSYSYGGYGSYAGYATYPGCRPPLPAFYPPPFFPGVVICEDDEQAKKEKEEQVKKEKELHKKLTDLKEALATAYGHIETLEEKAKKTDARLKKAEKSLKKLPKVVDQKLDLQAKATDEKIKHLATATDDKLKEQARAILEIVSIQAKSAREKLAEQARAFDAKLAEHAKSFDGKLEEWAKALDEKHEDRLKIMTKTLELKMLEQTLKQGLDALKEKAQALEAAEKLKDRIEERNRQEVERLEKQVQRQLRRLEDKFFEQEKKQVQDPEARSLIRGLEQKIAAVEVLLASKLEAIDARLKGLAKKVQEDKLQQNFDRLDKRLQKIENKLGGPVQPAPADKIAPAAKPEPKKKAGTDKKDPPKKAEVPAKACRLNITLPAEAKLFINDRPIPGSGSQRSFLTPELKAGQTYSYTVRMEVMHNGKTETRRQQVFFQAGAEVPVSFNALAVTPPAAKTATSN